MPGQFPDAAPGEFPDAQGGSGVSIPDLIGPLQLKWLSGNTWVVGDTLPSAQFQLIDAGQNPPAPVPLDTAQAITIHIRSAIDRTLGVVSGSAAAVAGVVGGAGYDWQPGDLSVDGQLNCQVRVTWPGGAGPSTFPNSGYAQIDITAAL